MSSQLLKQIMTLIQENHYDEAQGVIGRVAAVQASDPAVLLELGKLSMLMGDLSSAEKYLKNSIALDTDNADAYCQLGQLMLKTGQFSSAVPLFRTACELRPNFALSNFYWGLTLYEMGNLRGAVGQFKVAANSDPTLFLATYYIGLASQKLGDKEQTKESFEQTIKQETNFAPAHNALGVHCFEQGNDSEAIICFQRACKLNPDYAEAHLNLANVFAKMGKLETAEFHYLETLKSPELSADERAAAYNNLAVLYAKQEKWEKSLENAKQAHQIVPTNSLFHINYGLALLALQEYDLAANKFEQIQQDDSEKPEADFYAGLSLLNMGKYEDSLKKFVKASNFIDRMQDTALHSQLLLWSVYARLANKQYQDSEYVLDKIIQDKKANNKIRALAFDALAVSCILQQKYSEAKRYLDQSLESDNGLAVAYFHRAITYEALDDNESASKDYAQALKLDANVLKASKDYVGQLLDSAQIEQALFKAMRICQLNPQDIQSQILLVRAYQKNSDYSKALSVLNDILKKDPNNSEAYTILGQIYMSQGDFAKADEIFTNAAQMENVEAELFLSWARALAYLGLHELALEKFKEAAEINPYDADIYESWAQALKSLGRFNEASDVYKLAASYL